MSSKDMFRKEQRFSFRKFSFGLASAVIANVIFGGAIANTPVVHANTTTETAAVATSERIASIPYTVNIVDQAGKVVETKEKKVLVYTVETIATATEYLTADLVPEGYAIVSGLGEVTLTENAENVFTVKVDKIAPEAVATTTTAESATSETSTAAATPEPASLAATQSTPVTSEVAEAEVAPTTSEESAKPTERTVYLSYITHYVNEANETVDRTGHLVAVTTTDDTAKTQVTVSASENMPSGWELVQDKAKVVVQLVENQTNILVFAVTKKSKEEEIAESQLSNRDVLMRLSLEADLLADEALRQVAKEQAGNTALETAANETKAVAATANEVLANDAATETELDDQIDTVRTSTQNLAAEMLKVDADGVLTAQLNTTQVSRPASYQEIGTEAGAFHPDKLNLTRYLFVFGTTEGTTESDADGAKGTAPVVDKTKASRALVPEGTITNIVYNDGKTNTRTLGSDLTMDTDGFLDGTFKHTAGGPYTRKLIVTTTDTGVQTSNEFTVYAYTDKASSDPVKKLEGKTLTEDDVFAKMAIATTSENFKNAGKNIPTVPAAEYTRTIVGYRVGTTYTEQTDLTKFPTDKDYQVKVKTTNVYGQTIYNWVNVDYNLKPIISTIGDLPNKVNDQYVNAKETDSKAFRVVHVFGNVTGTTETGVKGETAPVFDPTQATKTFPITDPENDTVTITYDIPADIKTYDLDDPSATTYNGNGTAKLSHLDQPMATTATLTQDGRLTGRFPWSAGDLVGRRIIATDSAGNVTKSNPFYIVTYTDKLKDTTDLTVATASDLTKKAIENKLLIDTITHRSSNDNLTVDPSNYTRTIVGYRVGDVETEVQNEDLSNFPRATKYHVKVKTTNVYGQTIYNWVPVNDTRTAGTDKKPLYVFNNTPIATVGAGTDVADKVDKVKVVTLKDPDGINSVVISRESDTKPGSFSPAPIGITIDTDGNASGTPAVGAIGVYSRGLTVIDGTWATENLFPRDNEMQTFILDATADGTLQKQVGETVTKDEILAKVKVDTGNSNTVVADPTTMYKMDLAPGEKIPTAPGEYDVKVRVITDSNVYKDVPVKVIIPKYSDTLTATAAENTSLVPGSGTAATQPIVINDANGATTAPAGTTYEIDPAFKAEKEALGYKISVSPTGEVSVIAPAGQEADITVPVTVTYPDKTTDSVSVPFKVNQKDLAQLKAKEAIDEKLADETKDLEDKKNAEIAAITNNPDLTQEQKDAAIQDITDAAEIAKKALNDAAGVAKDNVAAATTPEEAKAAQTAGENTLADLENGAEAALDLITAKAEATDAINDKLADELKDLAAKQAEAEKAIDASTMTPEEKVAAKEALQDVVDAEKAKLEDAAKKATDAVDAATTPADVKAAEIAGETALTEAGKNAEAAVDLAKDKELAKEAIRTEAEEATKAAEKLADDAIKAINDNPNLTDDEKKAAIDKVNDAAKVALDTIADNAKAATEAAENAQALADLEAAKKAQKDADKGAIDTATPLVDAAVLEAAKQDALNKLEDDAAKAKETIAANPNLSKKEVDKALADLEKDLAKAKDAVNAATTPEKVQTAEDKGVDVIAGDVLAAAQLDALNKLEDDTKETIAAIEANPNLTEDEKKAAIAKAEDLADDAKSDIMTAETPEAVQAVEEKADKDLAKEELKAATDDAKKAIDANPNLTPDEKKVAKDALDAEVAKATEAIDKAATPADVNTATLAGEKAAAKAEVEAAADDAKKAIASNPNLDDTAKAAAIKAVEEAAKQATEAIDAAKTPADVNAATLAGEKAAAKEELKAAAADAIAAINANPNLDDAAKAEAVKAVEDAAKTATEAIDAAKTPADVNAATLAGEKAVAKAEVAAAAADAIEAIKANPNLDDTAKAAAIKGVEDAAKTATEAIDAAKTPADVNAATLAGEQAVAKAEVATAAADAIEAIKANPNLDDTAKAAAIK
ncbi:TPA: DUF1542 domain-containing protein, partial [Streptococcus suis]|nr:DUF1542 domain-containing protein [Streptococcus suis]